MTQQVDKKLIDKLRALYKTLDIMNEGGWGASTSYDENLTSTMNQMTEILKGAVFSTFQIEGVKNIDALKEMTEKLRKLKMLLDQVFTER